MEYQAPFKELPTSDHGIKKVLEIVCLEEGKAAKAEDQGAYGRCSILYAISSFNLLEMRYGDLTCCGSDTSAKQWSIVYLYSAGDGCPLLLLIAGLPKHRSLPSWISL